MARSDVPRLWRGHPNNVLDDVPAEAADLVISRPEIRTNDTSTLNTTWKLMVACANTLKPGGVLALCVPPTVVIDDATMPFAAWATMALRDARLTYVETIAYGHIHPGGAYLLERGGPRGRHLPTYEVAILASKGPLPEVVGEQARSDLSDLRLNAEKDQIGREKGIGGQMAGFLSKTYAQHAGVVLDTHAGDGTVAQAIRRAVRVPWLIEGLPRYWPHLDLIVQQTSLPDPSDIVSIAQGALV